MWYRAAYERGSSSALFGLGSYYYRRENYGEAEKIFMDGVSKNDAVSMYWLASIYVVRHQDGKDFEIKDLLERSAALGQIYAKNSLAFLLMKGRYGLRNIPRGIMLYFLSIIEGFKTGIRNPHDRRLW
jgi:TPR repeat protein